MTIHFELQKDRVMIAVDRANKSNNYIIKHRSFSEEFIKILQKEKINLKKIKKITIHKSKDASFLNERLVKLFKKLVILHQKLL